ncbi:hypothetical protein JW935_14850 [candidate division KSB1 bacterium]|nr:hypothetical protein [candidate division KSB1 bacterium]
MRWVAVLRNDIRFQFKYGFYYVYLLIAIIYIAVLQSVPGDFRIPLLIFFLFTDICVLGFFFVGGLVLLEKGQRILHVLAVTPMSAKEYVLGKIISLALMAFLTSYVITLAVLGWINFIFHFCYVVLCSSIFYTAFGLIVVVRSKNLNHYFFRSIVYTIFLLIPAIDFFQIFQSRIFYLWPTKAALILLSASFYDCPVTDVFMAYISLLIWMIAAVWAAQRQIERLIHGEFG